MTKNNKDKKVANAKAKMVFYGLRTINYYGSNKIKYRRFYVAPDTPDIVVMIELVLPKDHWNRDRYDKVDIDKEMNKLAKKFFPKAKTFMFYNRVSHKGIIAPVEEPPIKAKFSARKDFSKK